MRLTDGVMVTVDCPMLAQAHLPSRPQWGHARVLVSHTRRTTAMIHRPFMVSAVVWVVSLVATPTMAQQAVEGAGKVLTAPAEVPKGTVEGTVEGANKGAPVAGSVAGTVEGTGKAVRKAGRGTADGVEGTGKAVGDTLRGLGGKE